MINKTTKKEKGNAKKLKKRKANEKKERKKQKVYTFYFGYFIGNSHDLIQVKSSRCVFTHLQIDT